MASIYEHPKSGIYHVAFWHEGHQYRKSLQTKNRRKAEEDAKGVQRGELLLHSAMFSRKGGRGVLFGALRRAPGFSRCSCHSSKLGRFVNDEAEDGFYRERLDGVREEFPTRAAWLIRTSEAAHFAEEDGALR